MASEYDGSIKLAATFDVNSIKQSAQDMRKEMDKAFDNTSAMKVTKEVDSLRQSIRNVSREYDIARQRAEELENTVKETPEYDKLWDSLVELKQGLVDAKLEVKNLERTGQNYGRTYYDALANVNAIERQIVATEKELQKMRDLGTAYTFGDQTKEYADTLKKMDDAANKMRILKQRTDEQAVSALKSSKGWKAMGIVFGTLGKDIKNLISKLKQLTSHLLKAASGAIANGFKKLGSAVAGIGSQAKSSEFSFNKLFKTLLKYGIGVRSFFLLYRKVRAAVIDGIQEMAQAGGGLNPLAVTIREFQTSLQYLKNSLATAFAPIAEVVLPLLTSMMDRMAQVIQYVGAFIKAIQGASTYMKAVRTPYKSKEEDKAEKADIKAQNKANQAAAKAELKERKEQYKKDVANEKAAIKARDKERSQIERSNKQISKNNIRTAKNTTLKNKNTKAVLGNSNAWKKQKDVLAGFDDLDVLGMEEKDTVLGGGLETPQALPPEIPQSLQDFNDALAEVPEITQQADEAFKESEIPEWISDLANKIKDFIDRGDWYGLGAFLGEKFNGLLQVVDDWINSVLRPKGVQWAQNIAQLLNGLVATIDWELLGKTIADGVNAIFDIVNKFLTTFDFLKFGKGLGRAIKSWFDNIEWDLIGQTFAHYWNALFHTIEGIVTTPGIWTSIGTSIGTFLKNAIQEIDIDSLATIFISVFNGIFEMLRAFIDTNPFEGLAVKIYNALNRMIHEIDWEAAGKTLSDLVIALLNVFMEVAENTDWVGFGQAIGNFLGSIDWVGILGRIGTILWDVFSGILKGLFSTDAGKVFLGILAGIEGLKIAFALGAKLLLPAIEKILIEKLAQLLVTGGFKSIFTACVSAVSGAFTSILATIASAGPMIVTAISTLLTTITTVISTALTFLFSPTGIIIMIVAGALILIGKYIYDNWDTISAFLSKCWQWFIDFFNQLPEFIQNVLKMVANIFINIINFTILKVELFVNIIVAAVNTIINTINALLGPLNAVIAPLTGGNFNLQIPNVHPVSLPRIPNLAQGAVIPPNKEFLAMLGDQKSGTNIEAPLDTIVDAFRQVVGNMQVQNTGYSEMTLDGQVFARLATPYVISELNRRGYDVKVLEA